MEAFRAVSTWIQNDPALVGAAAAALAFLVLLVALWRTSLRLRLSYSSEPETAGRFLAMARFGPVSLQSEKKIGQPVQQSMYLFGVRLPRRKASSSHDPKSSRTKPSKTKKRGSARKRISFIMRHWNLRDIGAFVWRRRRDFHIRGLAGRIEFSFADPEYTGEIYGALCALTGVIPPLRADADGSIRTNRLALFPNWSLADRVSGHIEAGLDVRIVRLAAASLFFILTRWHLAPRRRTLRA